MLIAMLIALAFAQSLSADVEHVGLVVSGAAMAAFADGKVIEVRAGDFFFRLCLTIHGWLAIRGTCLVCIFRAPITTPSNWSSPGRPSAY
jgi:hypothetical protein